MNTKDKNLLESLIQKYGASNVNSAINKLNELNSKTYMNAAIEARKRNQLNRTIRFASAANDTFKREEENSEIDIYDFGFMTYLDKGANPVLPIKYFIDKDLLIRYNTNEKAWFEIKPGDDAMRTENRKQIRVIINYFKKFKSDSKYNNRDLWIA